MMNKCFRVLNVRMYEYKLLEKYLNEMAKRGWCVVSFHYFLTGLIVFEKCENTDTRYMVDYYKIQKSFDINEEEKMKEYHMLVEQYGYQYILSWDCIQIYKVISENAMLVHDDTSEEGMKENVRRSLKYKILFTLFSILVLFFSSHGSTWNLLCYMVCCQIYVEIPYINYLIMGRETKSIMAMKCNTIVSIFLGLSLLILFLIESPLLGSTVIIFSIGYTIFQSIQQKKKNDLDKKEFRF